MLLTVKVKRLTEDAILPSRAHPTDAGLDLYANEDSVIKLGTRAKVKTGIAIEIPPGYYGKVEDRSSMASKGIRTGGGVIDSGYLGDVTVVLHNLSGFTEQSTLRNYAVIKKGDKIAQLIIQKIETPSVEEVIDFDNNDTLRGTGGFGSTGQ